MIGASETITAGEDEVPPRGDVADERVDRDRQRLVVGCR